MLVQSQQFWLCNSLGMVAGETRDYVYILENVAIVLSTSRLTSARRARAYRGLPSRKLRVQFHGHAALGRPNRREVVRASCNNYPATIGSTVAIAIPDQCYLII